MVNRPLVWAGENSRLERVANTNLLVAKVVHRYVAGPILEDGVAAAVQLNGQGIRGILDLRASGTNDKAGSVLNLLRWVSPQTIKETFAPATDYRYPFMR
jgi:hypothetical protein